MLTDQGAHDTGWPDRAGAATSSMSLAKTGSMPSVGETPARLPSQGGLLRGRIRRQERDALTWVVVFSGRFFPFRNDKVHRRQAESSRWPGNR